MPKHILLTGKPRIGKTTLLKKIIKELSLPCGGFYTEEIKEGDERVGFSLITLNGKEGLLAKKGASGSCQLGDYGVNLKDLEDIGVAAVEDAIRDKEMVVIDEIGRMELFSEKFKEAVMKALDSGKRLFGVIHRADLDFLNKIRARLDVRIFEVTAVNHDQLFHDIKSMLQV